MKNLGELFLKKWFPEQNKRLPKFDNKYDSGYAQVTVIPKKTIHVVYTKDGKPVEKYGDLLKLDLNEIDRKIVEEQKNKLSENPSFTNGDHILVKEINYDAENNIVYLEAVGTNYVVMNCLQNQLFCSDSPLSKIVLWRQGVISPYITKDNFTYVMERSTDKFYAAAAGFIQPETGDITQINFPLNEMDFVARQGVQESNEEFLWDINNNPRLEVLSIENRVISMRKIKDGMPVLEFISPIKLNCNLSELEAVLHNNQAPDRTEHTANHVIFNLVHPQIIEHYNTKLKDKSGIFLYEPIIQSVIISSESESNLDTTMNSMSFCV